MSLLILFLVVALFLPVAWICTPLLALLPAKNKKPAPAKHISRDRPRQTSSADLLPAPATRPDE